MRTLLFLFLLALPALAYDPLEVPPGEPRTLELPGLKVYLPTNDRGAPVVLFSHGLGGSKENSSYLGRHWAKRGYVAVFMQHPGSDEAVWKDTPAAGRMAAMREAANGRNLITRVKDVGATLDSLKGRGWDLGRVGMSGHSFGALTTQYVGGQRPGRRDPRIVACLPMSPSTPRIGGVKAFADVSIPWLLMTGTKDVAPIGGQDLASRLAVYPALPPGGKYELVLDGAEHSAFGERVKGGNPNHHRVILALSTAFWDAWVRRDPAARAWLDGAGPRSVLEPKDRWQRK